MSARLHADEFKKNQANALLRLKIDSSCTMNLNNLKLQYIITLYSHKIIYTLFTKTVSYHNMVLAFQHIYYL
ncbi:hypothetical protein A359_08110 [secondary endosymbiont of Ctenarytaina eucalypti]|uniref:Uncharacterized protein n=1 Tax=secondary endosymbiont of Ctenarytaina eucalypti TaxID=1199245 RepID=J3TFU4_9ENTR|nr:hypothetical protein A359_08110 [secondary endosymbiont of Ctenarytaina eucalypti]